MPLTVANCPIHLQLQVYQEFSQTTDRCTTSKLRLYHAQSRRYRSVWHLQYADWAEQNCPRDVNHFLDFLEELNSVRLASTHEVPPGHNTNPPVLIHCLEGGGRSGVTLTADLLLYTLDHNEVRTNIQISEYINKQNTQFYSDCRTWIYRASLVSSDISGIALYHPLRNINSFTICSLHI